METKGLLDTQAKQLEGILGFTSLVAKSCRFIL